MSKKFKIIALIVAIALAVTPAFVLSIGISIAMSQLETVIIAMDEEPEENTVYLSDEKEEPEEPEEPDISGSGRYFSVYHAKADFLLSKYNELKNALEANGTDKIQVDNAIAAFDGNPKLYLEAFSIISEICMRDEINPGITSNCVNDSLHDECTNGVITPEFLIGKITTETSFVKNAYIPSNDDSSSFKALYTDNEQWGSNGLAAWGSKLNNSILYWFDREKLIGYWKNGDGSDFDFTLGDMLNADNFKVLTEEEVVSDMDYNLDTNLVMRNPYALWYGYSDNIMGKFNSYSDTCTVTWIAAGAFGPLAQNLLGNINWNWYNTGKPCIYISKLENPDLDDNKRAVYGCRGEIYKLDSKVDSELYNKYASNAFNDETKSKYDNYSNAHYLTGVVWKDGLSKEGTAYFSEVSSSIKEGNMYVHAPTCYQSRPATYYFPDALYTVALSYRAELQGTHEWSLESGGELLSENSAVSTYTAKLTKEQSNDLLLYLVASTQAYPYYLEKSENIDKLLSEYEDHDKAFDSAWGNDGIYTGCNNIYNGDINYATFTNVIDQCYSCLQSTYEDTDTAFQDFCGISASSSSDLTDAGFMWPVQAEGMGNCNCVFGRAGLADGYGNYGEAGSLGVNTKDGHSGIDIIASEDTDVLAAAAGTVVYACLAGNLGNHVVIQHENGLYTTYSHLSEIYVKVDQKVTQGQEIGKAGGTGTNENSYSPHLHFEVLRSYTSFIRDHRDLVDPLFFDYSDRPKFGDPIEAYYTGSGGPEVSGTRYSLAEDREHGKIMARLSEYGDNGYYYIRKDENGKYVITS